MITLLLNFAVWLTARAHGIDPLNIDFDHVFSVNSCAGGSVLLVPSRTTNLSFASTITCSYLGVKPFKKCFENKYIQKNVYSKKKMKRKLKFQSFAIFS